VIPITEGFLFLGLYSFFALGVGFGAFAVLVMQALKEKSKRGSAREDDPKRAAMASGENPGFSTVAGESRCDHGTEIKTNPPQSADEVQTQGGIIK
jgi:hypothetical protein